ncbi:MAG: hypothetical protein IJX47_02410 [Clostridia bacterium]|nr:hypothetical protein [Clostridia bacterium]
MITAAIKGADWSIQKSGTYLILHVSERDARAACEAISAGGEFVAEIKKPSRKRSLDANNYLWALCDQISASLARDGLAISTDEIYRKHVRIGGVREVYAVDSRAVDRTIERWGKCGKGWFAEVVDGCKIPRCTRLCFYFGSSTYTTEEMQRLLTSVVQEAQDLGIETLTGAELALLREG